MQFLIIAEEITMQSPEYCCEEFLVERLLMHPSPLNSLLFGRHDVMV